MKGKILNTGILMLSRGPAEKFKLQRCTGGINLHYCSDVCPFFADPKWLEYSKTWSLVFCNSNGVVLKELLDERS